MFGLFQEPCRFAFGFNKFLNSGNPWNQRQEEAEQPSEALTAEEEGQILEALDKELQKDNSKASVTAGQEKAKAAATTKAPQDKAPSAVPPAKRKEPSETELEKIAMKELKKAQKEEEKQSKKRPAAAGAATPSASNQDAKKKKDSGSDGTTAMGLAASLAKQKTAAKTID